MTLEEALEQAYRERPDYLAAHERLKAAEEMRGAAVAERLPSVRVTADLRRDRAHRRPRASDLQRHRAVDVPIFDGGTPAGPARPGRCRSANGSRPRSRT